MLVSIRFCAYTLPFFLGGFILLFNPISYAVRMSQDKYSWRKSTYPRELPLSSIFAVNFPLDKVSITRLAAKKIDDEISNSNPDSKKKSKNSSKKSKRSKSNLSSDSGNINSSVEISAVGDSNADDTVKDMNTESRNNSDDSESIPTEDDINSANIVGLFGNLPPDPFPTDPADSTQSNLQKRSPPTDVDAPLTQAQMGSLPPEIVFFGDPRRPPPAEAIRDPKYHGRLLAWARHSTVAPRNTKDRLETVFPLGRLHPEAPKYRLISNTATAAEAAALSFEDILSRFEAVMGDIEASKAFISANIELVCPKQFLRAITGRKLEVQYKGDSNRMDELKDIRWKYQVAQDQLFFPLNIEVMKAETRVMTYLSRLEVKEFAENTWDEVETSLHFVTLLAARLTWDAQVKEILDKIKQKVDDTVGYMADGVRADLMSREFRKPGLTAEAYLNATMTIQRQLPKVYAKVRPELRFLHETYFTTGAEELRDYASKVFCPNNKIAPEQLKERLRILEHTLSGIQGVDYTKLRLLTQNVFQKLCADPAEVAAANRWYIDVVEKGYDFETYEPDVIPPLIASRERIKDNNNAFVNFGVQVMKMPTVYGDAFSGLRSKASDPQRNPRGDWLKEDPVWVAEKAASYEETLAQFREAYIEQTKLRKAAEERLGRMILNRMENQDRMFLGGGKDSIMEF